MSSPAGRCSDSSSSSPACLWPDGLRCEGLVAPAGVETTQPRLSWQLQAPPQARGCRPTACHVRVASSAAGLLAGSADRWDSGVVETASGHTLTYAGAPLQSLDRCYWAVRVRDEAGAWSDWNPTGQWNMGLMDPSGEWQADWIHAPDFNREAPEGREPDPWLRREVHCDVVPERAVALVASIGYHEFYVNGQKVGDAVLTPNVYDFSRCAVYVVYDFAPYLQPGANVLGLWLGSGWSVYPHFQHPDRPPRPLVSAQFHFPGSASRPALVTGPDWLAHPSPITLLGDWDFQNFGGESYDARAEIDAWARPGLDLGGWRRAVRCDLQLPLRADLVEPNRPQEELRPRALTEREAGVYCIDFGRNFAGWVEVPLAGPPGSRIALEFSEREDESVTHRIRSEYVIGPSGHGTFRLRFNYASGRWLTLRGLAAPPDVATVRGWCVRNDYTSAAAFRCSDESLNAIVDVARWTFENLTLGGFVADCPQRERMGYGGDGHASITTGLYHYRLEAFLTKWNRDWHDVQGRPPKWAHAAAPANIDPPASGHPGEMPYTAPTHWGGGGPAWSGLCVHLPWQLYRFSGNRRVLEQSLPVITRWLAFLETKVVDHLLRRWGGRWDFLGDWMAPDAPGHLNADSRETLLFNNCYRIWSLDTAARIARVLGAGDAAEHWEGAADRAREAVRAEFHTPATGGYGDDSQVSLAAALLARVPEAAQDASVEQRLEDAIRRVHGGHLHAGITGGALVFLALLERNRHDLLDLVVRAPGYPGWRYMTDQGATTLWESWHEPTGSLSRLHSSFLFVGAWPLAGVLGIAPVSAAPGFARLTIRPGPFGAPGLAWARGHYDSVRGRITVAWRVEAGVFTLDVGVPPGAVAEIALPTLSPAEITESGRPLTAGVDVTLGRSDGTRTFVEVGSGAYQFRCPLAPGASAAVAAAAGSLRARVAPRAHP